ncbi:glycoside hydrolase family 3 protein [Pontibacter chinhatensis]|uniref:Beta-glucosidase n=1 Tax=Pontibacter chinhatensis TaxID=1436961 RepID=A0A1I2XUI0_9BACT|nr:hypothetical protein [Pontibacter chinhatensis]SFH16757.1 beta-glucosidase [Pontibacter chinhatensis]
MVDEVYNNQTNSRFLGVLATFGVEPEALLDVVTGKYNPNGKMPLSTPVSQQAVERNREGLPGYIEGEGVCLVQVWGRAKV